MAAGRKPGDAGKSGGAKGVDPRAPTQRTMPVGESAPGRDAKRPATGAFAPDAATQIVSPTPSLDGVLDAFDKNAPTQSMLVPSEDDPFRPRSTDVELHSFSSAEAESEGAALEEEQDGTRLDLKRPQTARTTVGPLPEPDDDGAMLDVVEISLSDMESLPELADDESDEQTVSHDTVVNMPLPASLALEEDEPAAKPASVAPKSASRDPLRTLPVAAVVERRSHSPAALFDEDTSGVSEPSSEAEAPPLAPSPVRSATRSTAPRARAASTERTASRPSLVSDPSGDPPLTPQPVPAPRAEAPLKAREEGFADSELADEVEPTLDPESSDASEEALPALHKWKVVPTAFRALERGAPAAPEQPQGFGSDARPKTLQTVLWSPKDDEDEAAEPPPSARAQNPFWAPTDARASAGDDDDDEALESTEAPAPSDPRQAAAAYIHDAVAYLRSLSHFGAYLDEEVRRDFESRLLGANEKLRRGLTVLHSAFDDDER